MIFIKKQLLFTLILLGCSQFIFSQIDSAYLEFVMRSEKEYQDFKDKSLKEYKQFEAQYNQALELYRERIYKIWGKEGFKQRNKKEVYTEYSDDLKSRMTVDFKNGDVTIETVVDKGKDADTVAKAALDKHIETKGKYVTPNSEIKKISNDELLKNQADSLRTNKLKCRTKEVVGNDGKKRKVAKLELKLAPNHIKKRAELFLPLIQKYSQKYNVQPELVLAMIHIESYFNPKAKSVASACGLLQLVPSSGGRAAYKYVKGVDKIPLPPYLYVAENNIELGCAYLHILQTKVFGSVKDKKSKLYCLIASYNCGAGRLSEAFVNSKNLRKAITVINKRTNKQIYSTLTNKLPRETRNYLPIVLKRMENYRKWLKN